MRDRLLWFCLLSLLAAHQLTAEVKMPSVLSDGMVLQRGLPVHLWGTAEPDEVVSAEFRGEKKSTRANSLGRWNLYMDSGIAGGPYALVISGRDNIRFQDVLVGDVWLASGQSNMEFHTDQLKDPESELSKADLSNVRLLQIVKRAAEFPQL